MLLPFGRSSNPQIELWTLSLYSALSLRAASLQRLCSKRSNACHELSGHKARTSDRQNQDEFDGRLRFDFPLLKKCYVCLGHSAGARQPQL